MAKDHMTVRDLMTESVVTIRRNDPLSKADELMDEGHLRHLVVLDEDGQVCAVVSHRDIARGALVRALGFGSVAEERILDELAVKEVMSEEPDVTSPEAPIGQAAKLMRKNRIGCLPVLEGNELAGIITESDFLKLAID